MGHGDNIMIMGEASKLHNETGKKVLLVDFKGRVVKKGHKNYSKIFESSSILTFDEKVNHVKLTTKPGNQQRYMVTTDKSIPNRSVVKHKKYKPIPYRLEFTDQQQNTIKNIIKDLPEEFCIINPDYKHGIHKNNKNWGWEKFQKVCDVICKDIPVVRLKPANSDKPDLIGATNIITDDVMIAFGVAGHAKFGLTYEGGLSHAMAGLGVPFVVMMGGLLSFKKFDFGYDIHSYIEYPDPESPCGRQYDCEHCVRANEYMTVDMVLDHLKKIM